MGLPRPSVSPLLLLSVSPCLLPLSHGSAGWPCCCLFFSHGALAPTKAGRLCWKALLSYNLSFIPSSLFRSLPTQQTMSLLLLTSILFILLYFYPPCRSPSDIPLILFLKIIYLFFNWRITTLQDHYSFCQISTSISHRCTCVPSS